MSVRYYKCISCGESIYEGCITSFQLGKKILHICEMCADEHMPTDWYDSESGELNETTEILNTIISMLEALNAENQETINAAQQKVFALEAK